MEEARDLAYAGLTQTRLFRVYLVLSTSLYLSEAIATAEPWIDRNIDVQRPRQRVNGLCGSQSVHSSGIMSSSSKPPDSATGTPVPIPRPQANTLLKSFTTFLTLTIHTILYYRGIYPKQTFLMAKAHNLPVPQSRHPGLCEWINSALAAIQDQLALGSVSKVCIVVHSPDTMAVVERWVFDVASFPVWVTGKGKDKLGAGQRFQRREEDDDDGSVNWVDVNEAYRGALRRISYAGEMKGPLPEGCTFTLAVELRDEAPAPIGVGFLSFSSA